MSDLGMLAQHRKGQSRDTLRFAYAKATDDQIVTYAWCFGVTVAKHAGGRLNRLTTIERLIDTLAPLPEVHLP